LLEQYLLAGSLKQAGGAATSDRFSPTEVHQLYKLGTVIVKTK
jgi:hypothetical protein